MSKSADMALEQVNILHALERIGSWATSAEIREAAGLELVALYTIQRRLLQLEAGGMIKKKGHGRGSLYSLISRRAVSMVSEPVIPTIAPVAVASSIVLSAQSLEIDSLVTRPEKERERVGYNREWVLSYRPNKDFYLNERERSRLHIMGATPTSGEAAGTYARQMLPRLLIDLSWNSSRLEGNTYSLLETQRLLAEGHAASKKNPAETQMIINHKDAIEFIVENADETGMNAYTIRNLHAMLSYNLLPDPASTGRLRQHAAGIGKSVYSPPDNPAQIEELFTAVLAKADAIHDPFEQAFFVMVHLPYLQPFEYVNKRVSRLAANIPLNRNNLVPLSFVDVPKELYIHGLLGIYELNKVSLLKEVFLWAYERSVNQYATVQQTLGEPDLFRMEHAAKIRSLISHVISSNLNQEQAGRMIAANTSNLPAEEGQRLRNAVEMDLLSLHEGNFARYRVTPMAFRNWQKHWRLL